MSATPRRDHRALGSFVFGIGFGAFVDGIVLHQILQWHHMLSSRASPGTNTVQGLEANMLADGLFHLVALVALVAGVMILRVAWRDERPASPWGAHIGMGLAGWATFNLIEGVVNHHVLGIHHVRENVTNREAWDLGFLGVSAMMLLAGLALWSATKTATSKNVGRLSPELTIHAESTWTQGNGE